MQGPPVFVLLCRCHHIGNGGLLVSPQAVYSAAGEWKQSYWQLPSNACVYIAVGFHGVCRPFMLGLHAMRLSHDASGRASPASGTPCCAEEPPHGMSSETYMLANEAAECLSSVQESCSAMSFTSHDSCTCWPPMKRSRKSCYAFRSFCTCCTQAVQAQLNHARANQRALLICPLSLSHTQFRAYQDVLQALSCSADSIFQIS